MKRLTRPSDRPFVLTAPPSATRGLRSRGVTLIELIVVLAVVTLVLTIGTVGLTQLFAENQRVAEVNTLAGTLNFARAEAIYRASKVVVCPIDPEDMPSEGDVDEEGNPDLCSADANAGAGSGVQWSQGYLVYVEDSGEWLRLQPAVKAVTIDSGERTQVAFSDDGSATNATLKVCDARDDAATDAARSDKVVAPRQVVVSLFGRTHVEAAADIDCN